MRVEYKIFYKTRCTAPARSNRREGESERGELEDRTRNMVIYQNSMNRNKERICRKDKATNIER